MTTKTAQKVLLATALAFLTVACGNDKPVLGHIVDKAPTPADDTAPGLQIFGADDDVTFAEWVVDTYTAIEHDPELDPAAISIYVDPNKVADVCKTTDGCTWRDGDRINIALTFQWSPYANGELLAHELGHALCMQTYSPYDGDPGHTHHELYARPSGEYAGYTGEIGVPTMVARVVGGQK